MYRKPPVENVKAEIQNQLISSIDFKSQTYTYMGQKIEILYLSSLCDEKKMKNEILEPLNQKDRTKSFEKYLEELPNLAPCKSSDEAVQLLLKGNIGVFLSHTFFFIDMLKQLNDQQIDANVENAIQGPQLALSENVTLSLSLIRGRYHSPTLKVEERQLGKLSQTKIYILYDEVLAEPESVKILKDKLSNIHVDVLQAAGQLERFVNDQKRSLFPKMMITERPDRVAINLSQGKVVILINGTPFALIGPTVFYDFFSAVDDLYQNYFVSRFLVILRYLGLFISLTVPALYVAIASFNPEIFRVQLTLSIAGSRAAVPYPSFIEVLFMLGTMEFITEASIRLPKAIGPTATTVGGLILGQAAQQAGLVSTIMIIVVAAVAIANFVIPINSMSFAIRVAKYFLIVLASFFGIIGVVAGMVGMVIYLCGMRSLGQPYFKLFMFESEKVKVNVKENK